eukprot:TRINITY_DN4208_c4_g1_i1.p1 TRINITY_DN4208_c4_g1~~TRINITY_DN4208_c4_g1_i1.p1  ORF type:complete len:311 (+),score=-69.99 TRINITY_DN4208_c4_g1_i1:281-1213(+)
MMACVFLHIFFLLTQSLRKTATTPFFVLPAHFGVGGECHAPSPCPCALTATPTSRRVILKDGGDHIKSRCSMCSPLLRKIVTFKMWKCHRNHRGKTSEYPKGGSFVRVLCDWLSPFVSSAHFDVGGKPQSAPLCSSLTTTGVWVWNRRQISGNGINRVERTQACDCVSCRSCVSTGDDDLHSGLGHRKHPDRCPACSRPLVWHEIALMNIPSPFRGLVGRLYFWVVVALLATGAVGIHCLLQGVAPLLVSSFIVRGGKTKTNKIKSHFLQGLQPLPEDDACLYADLSNFLLSLVIHPPDYSFLPIMPDRS